METKCRVSRYYGWVGDVTGYPHSSKCAMLELSQNMDMTLDIKEKKPNLLKKFQFYWENTAWALSTLIGILSGFILHWRRLSFLLSTKLSLSWEKTVFNNIYQRFYALNICTYHLHFRRIFQSCLPLGCSTMIIFLFVYIVLYMINF